MFVGYSSFYYVYCSCFHCDTDHIVGAWNYLESVELYEEKLAKFKYFLVTGRYPYASDKYVPTAPRLPHYWD